MQFKGHPHRNWHKMADKFFRIKGRSYVIGDVAGVCCKHGNRPRYVTCHVTATSQPPFCFTKWPTSFRFFKNNGSAAARALRARAGGCRPPPRMRAGPPPGGGSAPRHPPRSPSLTT